MTINLENYIPALKQGATIDISADISTATDLTCLGDTTIGDATTDSLTCGAKIVCGSSSTPLTTAVANTKFLQVYVSNTATSGDNRAAYLRLYTSGAGGSGDAVRIFHTVNAVVAANAHGGHTSLNFVSASNSGRVTGQGIASRNTLHIPNDASWSPGNVTYSALQAEIWCDGSSCDPQGASNLSFIRIVNGGDATGGADVDDDANLFQLSGFTVGSGNVIAAETDETKFSHKARIDIGGTPYYIMLTAS